MSPHAEKMYRDTSAKHAKHSNMGARQLCCRCKTNKPVSGGIRKALLPGAITSHNPMRFTCAECRK